MNHSFHPRWRRRINLALVLGLLVPTAMVSVISWQRQQQLSVTLAAADAELQRHHHAAEAIRARQHAAPLTAQQETAELKGLALLAQALRSDIALLSLELAPGERRMRLAVLSESLDTLLDFVTRLEHLPARVSLERHQSENTLPEPWKIRAQLTLEYSDAS